MVDARSGQTKEYKSSIVCFSTRHASLRSKNNNWLTRNQDNVSEWSDMSTRGLLFRWANIWWFQLSVLVLFSLKVDHLALKQITHACIYTTLIGKVAFNLNEWKYINMNLMWINRKKKTEGTILRHRHHWAQSQKEDK